MITIPKHNKKIEETLQRFADIILKKENITHHSSHRYSTEENDQKLIKYYKEKGLDNYQLHVPHTLITDMPFNKSINLDFMKKNSTYKPYTIPKGKYEAKNYGIYDEMGDNYIPLVVFDEDITLPMICEDNIGWMTPVLFEDETMKPCVEKAFGHVLVMGLGIGFYPFNILLKEEVKKVTIVEYNEEIIALFKEHILPQFPRRDDIEIIHASAYDYLNNDTINRYDYTFVDIWRNNEDGVMLLSNCLKNIDLSEDLSIDFWIEEAILEEVKISLKIYLYQMKKEKLEGMLTGKISEKREVEDFITFDKIHRYFKDKKVKIKNNADLMNVVNDKRMLREMLKSF